MHYLPSFENRCWELLKTLYILFNPPKLQLQTDDVVLVLDAIEAYRSMFTREKIENIRNLLLQAKETNTRVIFTRWSRFTPLSVEDAVDVKKHWSNYIPNQNEILVELAGLVDNEVSVVFPNAFTQRKVKELTKEAHRLVFAGGWTESCVYHTAHAGLEHNFQVALVSNACVGHFIQAFFTLISFQTVLGQVLHC